METEGSRTTGQTVLAVGVVATIATVFAVKMGTAWVWRSLVGAFEGDALDDMYDVSGEDEDEDEVGREMWEEVRAGA